MQNFIDEIRANGINKPIKFVEYNGNKHIVDGHHRYFAANKIGIEQVPVQQVELPYVGYNTVDDFQLFQVDWKMPGYWKWLK